MEFIQVFDRTLKQWTEPYKLIVGYKEEWKLDKSTDVGKDFQLTLYDHDGTNKPSWDTMDWCRVLHLREPSEAASYTSDGLPLNHTQYIIGGVEMIHNPSNGNWTISLALAEPIERMSAVIGETLSYTNQTLKKVKKLDGEGKEYEVTYRKEPYNHLTALERFLRVTPANNNVEHSWLSRIKILDKDWLRGIPFADTTFNELSLYNVLMDNFDSSTGRTPVMYFDMDRETDLPNDMTRDCYILKFERQDGYDKPVLDFEELKKDCTRIKYISEAAHGIKGLVTNVDNLMSDVAVNFPAQSLYAVPEVNADKRDTTGYKESGDDWVLKFPYKIKRITKLEVLDLRGNVSMVNGYTTLYRKTANITDKVYEKKQYLADDAAFEEDVFWYEEGGEVLHLRPYKYRNTDYENKPLYYVEYEPLIDCRVELGNNDIALQVNQTTAQPSAEHFGKFMTNYLNSMSNADILIQKSYTNIKNYNDAYEAFANHIGCRVEEGNKTYMITNVSYVNRGGIYDVVYQLNENHFRKNTSYQAPQNIRTNTAIPIDNIKDRRTFIKQTIRLGFTEQETGKNQFLKDKKILLSALVPNTIDSKYYPQLALIESTSLIQNKETGVWESGEIPNLLAEVAQFTFGNQVNVNIQFYDNALAGKSKGKNESIFFSQPSLQTPILYTDYFGEVFLTSINLSSIVVNPLYNIDKNESPPISSEMSREFARTIQFYDTMLSMPKISGEISIGDLKNNSCVEVVDLTYYKDTLEKLNITMGFEVVSDDAIICDGLLKNSRLMRQADYLKKDDEQETPSFTLDMKIYSKPKGINDDESGYIETINLRAMNDSSTDNSTYYNLMSKFPDNAESVVIYAGENYAKDYTDAKLLIINKLSANIREQFARGELTIYFG